MPWGPTGLYFSTARQTTRGFLYPHRKRKKITSPLISPPKTHIGRLTSRKALGSPDARMFSSPPDKMVGMGKRSTPTSALRSPTGGRVRRAVATTSGHPIQYHIPTSAVRR